MMDFKQLRKNCPWHDAYPVHEGIEGHEQEHHACNALRYENLCNAETCAIWYFLQEMKTE